MPNGHIIITILRDTPLEGDARPGEPSFNGPQSPYPPNRAEAKLCPVAPYSPVKKGLEKHCSYLPSNYIKLPCSCMHLLISCLPTTMQTPGEQAFALELLVYSQTLVQYLAPSSRSTNTQ